MNSMCWRGIHLLLTLSALGCCLWLLWRDQHRPNPELTSLPGSDRSQLQADSALRSFLDVKSFGCNFNVPEGDNYGVISLLRFEDGKFRGRGYRDAWAFTLKPGEPRSVSFTLLRGRRSDGKMRVVGVTRTSDSESTSFRDVEEEFLLKLDVGISSSGDSETVRGCRVLGYLFSTKSRAGKSGQFGSLELTLEHRQTVAVIGVKTFPDADQASEWQLGRDKADP